MLFVMYELCNAGQYKCIHVSFSLLEEIIEEKFLTKLYENYIINSSFEAFPFIKQITDIFI